MSSLSVIVNLFGAVALLLFGLSQVTRGVSLAFATTLRTILATGTRNAVRSFLAGFAATLTLQSSTATALMTASFVERTLIKPRMAQILLLGANVGTAATAWFISRGTEWLSPLLLVLGFLVYRKGPQPRRAAGGAVIGIGLMLLSLHLLNLATAPVRDSPALLAFLALLDGAFPVAMVFSAALAFLASSSLAAVMLLLTLAHVLPGGLTVVMVLGANLGGALPPVVATLAGPQSAKRLVLGNFLARALGVVLILPLATQAAAAMEMLSIFPKETLAVEAHLAFNIIVAMIVAPLSGPLEAVLAWALPDKPAPNSGPRYLLTEEMPNTAIALASATREVLNVGDVVQLMLKRFADAFRRNDAGILEEIAELEVQVDRLQEAVKIYVSRLTQSDPSPANDRRSSEIIDYVVNLEHIGDIIDNGLVQQLRKKIANGLNFSTEGAAELVSLLDQTISNLTIAQTIFATGDAALANDLMNNKVDIRRYERMSTDRHLQRLRAGRIESLETSALHLDMLRDLKRINAHLASVAHPILQTTDRLLESRLREI